MDIKEPIFEFVGVSSKSVGHPLIAYIIRPLRRVSGFHWDPAYMGVYGIFLIFFILIRYKASHLKFALLLPVISLWLLTVSRNAFLIFTIIWLLILFDNLNKRYFVSILRKSNVKVLIYAFIIISSLSFMVIIPYLYSKYPSKIKYVINERFKIGGDESGTSRHLAYPYYSLKAITCDPIHFLIGYGNRNSGRAFKYSNVRVPGLYNKKRYNNAFEIESDIARTIANNGIIGIFSYIIWNLYLIITLFKSTKLNLNYKNEIFYVALMLLLVFLGGYFYVFYDSKWVWFLYFSGLVLLSINPTNLKQQENANCY